MVEMHTDVYQRSVLEGIVQVYKRSVGGRLGDCDAFRRNRAKRMIRLEE